MKVEYSYVIPILFGIILSYIASRFIKKQNITPYRGMPEEDLAELFENKSLNKVEKNILVDFYCHRMSIIKITIK